MNGFGSLLIVAAGGALGASARYLVSVGAARLFGSAFPWGTLAINAGGSLAMGLAAALLLDQTGPSRVTLFLMTGVLGGFTTFSTFSLETMRLVEAEAFAAAALYAVGSVTLAIGGLWAGLSMGRAL